MARPRRHEVPAEETIFGLVPPTLADTSKPESLESFALFAGQRAAGKSSLLSLLQSSSQDTPKPTVALEYTFARRSKTTGTTTRSAAKDVAHIWELGGGDVALEDLIDVVITTDRLDRATFGIVVDLTDPPVAVAALALWLAVCRRHAAARFDDLRRRAPKTAEKLMDARRAKYSAFSSKDATKGGSSTDTAHPDRRVVEPTLAAVPLAVFATKYDAFEGRPLLEKKAACQALRFLAHKAGASLSFVTTRGDKTSHAAFRTQLSYALFLKAEKHGAVETAADKPLRIPASADSFGAIHAAGPLDVSGLERKTSAEDAVDALVDALRVHFAVDDAKLVHALGLARSSSQTPEDRPASLAALIAARAAQTRDATTLPPLGGDEFKEPVVDEMYRSKLDALVRLRDRAEQREKDALVERKRRDKVAADRAREAQQRRASRAGRHTSSASSSSSSSEKKKSGGARKPTAEAKPQTSGDESPAAAAKDNEPPRRAARDGDDVSAKEESK